jgi:hypothetical protein
MGFNPLKEEGVPLEKQFLNWTELNLQPYDKHTVDPYTRSRVICLNGMEFEAQRFSHQFARNTSDLDLRQSLALVRRIEQEQQKAISGLVPGNESTLEHTIGYEQMEIDLTAYLARSEPDPLIKDALDFGLLEDFDHLYRYANLLDMLEGKKAESIIGRLTEVIPGRPTVAEHRHPYDEIRRSFKHETADILTKLHVLTIVGAEQQTLNFYNNAADRFSDPLARGLYQEIAQIEEQHLTHYESLLDADASWLEMLVLHEYNECYLYYSFMQQERDSRLKQIWEHHLAMEIEHLKKAAELIQQYEGRDAEEFLPAEFPHLTLFESNIDYVRDILRAQIDLTGRETDFVPVEELSETHRYFDYQQKVNINGDVPSQHVIEKHIQELGRDYRLELRGPHPVERFRELEAVTR